MLHSRIILTAAASYESILLCKHHFLRRFFRLFSKATNMDPLVKLTGPNGSYIYVTEVKGSYYQAQPEIHGNIVDVASDFKARQLNFVYVKSSLYIGDRQRGLHWVWEIVTMLRRKTSEVSSHLAEGSILDMRPLKAIEHLPSPRVLATHCRPEQLSASIRGNGTQLICLFRDPRAVAVSAFCHGSSLQGPAKINMSWKDFVYFFNNGLIPFNSWFTHVKLWSKFINENKRRHRIHVVYYEDLQQDPIGEIERLNKALCGPCNTELINAIARTTKFDKLKTVKDPIASAKNKMFVDGKYAIYRKGKTDDWKNYYTVKENEDMVDLIHSKLKGTGLKLQSCL